MSPGPWRGRAKPAARGKWVNFRRYIYDFRCLRTDAPQNEKHAPTALFEYQMRALYSGQAASGSQAMASTAAQALPGLTQAGQGILLPAGLAVQLLPALTQASAGQQAELYGWVDFDTLTVQFAVVFDSVGQPPAVATNGTTVTGAILLDSATVRPE